MAQAAVDSFYIFLSPSMLGACWQWGEDALWHSTCHTTGSLVGIKFLDPVGVTLRNFRTSLSYTIAPGQSKIK